jgi:hypothetical protein
MELALNQGHMEETETDPAEDENPFGVLCKGDQVPRQTSTLRSWSQGLVSEF